MFQSMKLTARPRRMAAIAMAFAALATQGRAVEAPFTLSSTSFKDGGMLPLQNGGTETNPYCLGKNLSPALSWTNVPAGAKSFALVMFAPEGRVGIGVNHMVVYNIPANKTSFAEGELSQPTPLATAGKITQPGAPYRGPCTPPGTSMHHYSFVVIATDLEPNALPPGLTHEELNAKLEKHTKASAGLVAFFIHP